MISACTRPEIFRLYDLEIKALAHYEQAWRGSSQNGVRRACNLLTAAYGRGMILVEQAALPRPDLANMNMPPLPDGAVERLDDRLGSAAAVAAL